MITIKVNKEHIAQGEARSSCNCPIALALMEAIPNKCIGVGQGVFWIVLDWFDLPPEAKKFRKAFDNGEAVEPFSFEIENLSCALHKA